MSKWYLRGFTTSAALSALFLLPGTLGVWYYMILVESSESTDVMLINLSGLNLVVGAALAGLAMYLWTKYKKEKTIEYARTKLGPSAIVRGKRVGVGTVQDV